MPTLAARDTIEAIAAVLRGAAMAGRRAWRQPEANEARPKEDQAVPELPTTADLLGLFEVLESRGIDFALIGGIAMLRYVEGRNTEDVDLLVATAAIERLPELEVVDRNRDSARTRFRSIRVDFLFTEHALFRQVAQRHVGPQEFGGRSIPCASPLGLTILKLYALPNLYRQGRLDRAALYETDVLMLVRDTGVNPDDALGELATHVAAVDLTELRRIVDEIRARLERMRRSQERAGPGGPGASEA